jgi:hypothetical protein
LNCNNKYEIENIIKNLPTKQSPRSYGYTAELNCIFKELLPIFFKLSQKAELEVILTHFIRPASP